MVKIYHCDYPMYLFTFIKDPEDTMVKSKNSYI